MGIAKNILSFIHMMSLPQDECEVYCREKRLERYEKSGGHISHLRLHSAAHRVLIPLMKADLFLGGKRLHIVQDNRLKTLRPVIFCPTHIGGVDIEMAIEAVKTPCWVVIGDPRELYKGLDGMLLQMNGWIPMDVLVKKDRVAAKAQMSELLRQGGSMLMFPEGVQNISPNALLGHLYAGAVELAITCGAEIVPIAIARRGDHYYFNIGRNIHYDGCSIADRFQLTENLRDRMATLLWELIEQFPRSRRKDIPKTIYEDYLKSVLTLNTEYSFTVEDILATQFHPKGITAQKEAFAFMGKLIPKKENAFMFDKRQKGLPF